MLNTQQCVFYLGTEVRPSMEKSSEFILWESILEQHGLSMARGENLGNGPIFYGRQYFDLSNDNAFTYTKPTTHARHKYKNKTTAEKLLGLVQSGLSLRAAARQLELHYFSARRTLKRYKENFTRAPESFPYRGENE